MFQERLITGLALLGQMLNASLHFAQSTVWGWERAIFGEAELHC
jgi:hypothetical protein